MIFRMGVDHTAFDLISAGTSSRETFICGVLIVSNTVIIQLAVVSLIEAIKAHTTTPLSLGLKHVATLPGLPTLAGGVAGAISLTLCSFLATQRPTWAKNKPWWVPAQLTACLVITLVGLALAVVASIMVPADDCGAWIIYAATIVTYAGSTPQLPLALLQVYTVMDAEQVGQEKGSETVRAVRWERVGVMISTLTTIAGSELLTAWIVLMPDGVQKAFLFTSVVLAVGGCVWLMCRHTRPRRGRRSVT